MQQHTMEGDRAIHPAVERTHRIVVRCVELAAVLCLIADFFVLLTGVVSRYVFNHPIVWGEEVASILFLWLGMLGAVVALARREHMALSTIVDHLPAQRRTPARAFAMSLTAVFLGMILLPAYQCLQENLVVTTPVLGISQSWRIAALDSGCRAHASRHADGIGKAHDDSPILRLRFHHRGRGPHGLVHAAALR